MDTEIKKLYKTVVKDLSRSAVVKTTPARVSFAVANLFKGIKEMHHRNVERLKTFGINVTEKAGNMADSISAGFQNLVQNNESKREFVNSFGENDKVQEAIDAKVDAEYAEDIQRKDGILASIQQDNRLVNVGAGFIIDAYQADVQKLKDRVVVEKTKPHRLLVNKMFLNQFKDSAAAKRIRLRERKKLKITVAKEVRKFDNVCHEIRKRYANNPAMIMEMIEEERIKLSNTALDFVTLREGLGHGVTDKEVWGAYFIGIDEMEVGIPEVEQVVTEEVAPVVVEEAAVQPVVVEEQVVTPEVQPVVVEEIAVQPAVVEEQVVTPEVQPVATPEVAPVVEEIAAQPAVVEGSVVAPEVQPVEQSLDRDKLNQDLVSVLGAVEQKAQEVPVGQILTPTVEQPVVTPEVAPVVEEIAAQPAVVEESIVAPVVEQPIVKEPSEQDVLLSGIDTLRAGYRDELNDGYNYNESEKKEWEDARLAEDISLKDTTLSYDEQEATVLSYEQGLKEQRDAIVEMEKQLAIIKIAEQKISELSRTIDPNLLKQVKGEVAQQEAAPEVQPEGFSR